MTDKKDEGAAVTSDSTPTRKDDTSPTNIAQLDPKIKDLSVSVFGKPIFNATQFRNVNWSTLCELAKVPLVLPDNKKTTKEAYGQYFVRGVISSTITSEEFCIGNREDENLTACWLLIMDVDSPIDGHPLPTVDEASAALSDITHLIYTTLTPGRIRIVVPVPAYQKEQTETLTHQLYELCMERGLKFRFAGEAGVKSQPWFFGQTLDAATHQCVANNGQVFTPDPARTLPGKVISIEDHLNRKDRNWPLWWRGQLQSGTLHEAAKQYAGWKYNNDRLQDIEGIWTELTSDVEAFCGDPEKVQRWHDKDLPELKEWYRNKGISKEEDLPPMATSVPKDDHIDLSDLLTGNGFLDRLIEYQCNYGRFQQREASLLSSCALLGTICNRVVIRRHCRPVIYGVHIGPSGSGKTTGPIDSIVTMIRFVDVAKSYHREMNYTSEAAFLNGLRNQPVQFLTRDELGEYLQDMNDINGWKRTVADMFLNGFTKHFGFRRDAGVVVQNFVLNYHFFCIFGSTTPSRLFSALKGENIDQGLLPRFLIFQPDPKKTKRNRHKDIRTIDPKPIQQTLSHLCKLLLAMSGIMDGGFPKDIAIDLAPDADRYYEKYADQCDDAVLDGPPDGPFISRRAEYALKLAFIRELCMSIEAHEFDIFLGEVEAPTPTFPDAIGLDSIKWGIEIMERYGSWVKRHLLEQIHEGEEGEAAMKILKWMRGRFEKGQKEVAGRDIANNVRIKDRKLRHNALEYLVESGQIGKVEAGSNAGGHRYYLVECKTN